MLRNAVTQEFHHVEALKDAGGTQLTTSYWFPDAAFDDGGVGLFSTLEIVETVEISLYLLGVSAYARAGEDFGARLCAEAMGTEAVHRALVRFAQGELGKDVGVPNDVGFENFDWQSVDRGPRRARGPRHRLRRAERPAGPLLRVPRRPDRARRRHAGHPHRPDVGEPAGETPLGVSPAAGPNPSARPSSRHQPGASMPRTRTSPRPLAKSWLIAALTAAIALIALVATTASAKPDKAATRFGAGKPTVVLVHGAWADASSWSRVIKRLQADGYPVIAPANPLRGLSSDSAYIASVLAQTPGPLVVVGHSYGGAVITNAAAGNANVKALVYVDAFIPDVGESIQNLGGSASQIPASIEFKGYPPFGPTDVDVYLKQDTFRSTFAGDLPARQAAELWASQRPLALAALGEPSAAAAWKTIPSWALIGRQDNAITPDAQRSMTRRAGSRTVEINASHVSLISRPAAVTALIEQAAAATAS